MPEVAFITGTLATALSNTPSPQQFVRNSGGVAYTLRKADGTNLGSYQTVSQARNAFASSFGLQNIQRWEQRNLPADIEQHVCIALPLDPKEIWGDSLITWYEPSLVPGSLIQQDVSLATILQINDLSGSDNLMQQLTPGDQATLALGLTFDGRNVIDFSPTQGYVSTTITALVPPYTIIAVANNRAPTVGGNLFDVFGGAPELNLGDDAATGAWFLEVGAATITSATISGANPDTVVVQQRTDGNLLRVNGVTDGSSAGIPAAGTFSIGGLTTDAWDGQLALLIIAASADDNELTRIRQTERYATDRYRTP